MCEENKNDGSVYQKDQIEDMGSVTTRSEKGIIHCLTVIGQVEGHQLAPQGTKTTKYEHVMPQLAAIEESDEIEGLLILLNTMGGDIEAGLGIAEMIAGMTKPTASLVLGGGHSIGVPMAVAADMSIIVPSASMTIHPVRITGVVIGAPQTYNYFGRIQERIVRFITENSRISPEKLNQLMMNTGEMSSDIGSIVYGEEAVEIGLIDRVGGLSDALGYLHGEIQRRREKRENTEE
jgi:ATP-dependent protease ClpP protease subunit